MKKHVILFLAANPSNTSRLALDEECAAIERELRMTEHRDDFEFHSKWAVTVDEMMRHLVELKPSIIHFSGHGASTTAGRSSATTRDVSFPGQSAAASSGIHLQGDQGGSQLVTTRALTMMIKSAAASARVVVLNACYSEPQADAVCGVVNCVVGMTGAIEDTAARSFAVGFYRALGNRCSVGNAVDQAVATLAAKGMPDEVLPRCVAHNGVDKYQVFLDPVALSSPDSARTGRHTPALVAAQSPGLGTDTFVGRDRELAEIESLLTGATDVQLRAALDGLPGIGKTELARQLVARLALRRKFAGGIFWFNAEHADLRMQWAKLAEDSGCPTLPDLDARAAWAVRQIERRAQQGDAILIVLDNVETWAPPPSPLPDVSTIRLLITTRVRWLHNSLRHYEVQPLELTHARELLQAIVGRELGQADQLLQALRGHVLSIELAATYLREYGTSPVEYLTRLAAGTSPGSSVADQTAYRATAESAFRLLWQQISPALRTAWVLAAQLPPAWFSSELAEAIGLDAESRRRLVRLHILERDDQGRQQMHRLLREFALTQEPPSPSLRDAVIQGATQLLESEDDALTFQRYRRDVDSFEHLVAVSAHVPGRARLMSACALGLRQLGDLLGARVLAEQALASDLKTYGDEHPEVAKDYNNLALLLKELGDLPAARVLYEQALASGVKTYGADHPTIAALRNNLAMLFQRLGDLPAACALIAQALASNLKTYGDDHLTVATCRRNLAGLLQELGDRPAARALFELALASHLKIYGEGHPVVATCRSNLAGLLRELGDLPTARALFEQALASDLKTYDEDHPEVARDRIRLAEVLQGLGDLQFARVLFEQALSFSLKSYGDDHPEVAIRRDHLAWLLWQVRELPAARALFEQALASNAKTLGEDHPLVAIRRNNLAGLLWQLGELPAARALFEQALASDLKTYGNDHPQVAIRRNNLAGLLLQLGELPTARTLFEQALAALVAVHGDNHPAVTNVRAHLATLIEEARPVLP